MESTHMSEPMVEVTSVDRPDWLQLSTADQEFALAIERDLPAHIEWLPQTMKFKFPLNEDNTFVYRPDFIFRDDQVGGLVVVVMEPDWISLGNLGRMKLLGDACRGISLDFVLLVNEAVKQDPRAIRQLREWGIPFAVIHGPADFIDHVVIYFRQRLDKQACA